jgi:hypothetical protein
MSVFSDARVAMERATPLVICEPVKKPRSILPMSKSLATPLDNQTSRAADRIAQAVHGVITAAARD